MNNSNAIQHIFPVDMKDSQKLAVRREELYPYVVELYLRPWTMFDIWNN